MYRIVGFTDIEGLKYKVASDPTIISQLASFAHMLGFGWCGGTQTGSVGTGFDVWKSGDDSYIMNAHYNDSDPYASGYWADKRLRITLSNFGILIDPATLVYGKPVISSLDPIAISMFTGINRSQSEDSISKTFSYQLSNTVSHTTSSSITEGIKVTIKNSAKVPFYESEVATEFSFSATQGWSDTTSTMYSSTDTQQYSGKLPPKSKRLIKLVVLSTKSQVGYTAQAAVTFNASLSGFLRWGGNARRDHPDDRPFVTVNFGTDKKSAFDDIVDKYDHRAIPNYSEWDWNWVQQQFGGWMDGVVGFFRDGVGVPLNGKFTNVKGVDAHIEADDPQPLTDAELRMGPADLAMAAPLHTGAIPHPTQIPPHLILRSDELPGGRVLSVD